MRYLKIFFCLLLTHLVYAEVPFDKIKALHEKVAVSKEKSIFSPIYGFLALKTGVLERIRFFGNYGKIYKADKTPIAPGILAYPEWIHPVFKVQKHTVQDQFEYPLDAISALIQWLFPSIDGSNFVANDRRKDPVGEMGLNLTRVLHLEESYKKIKNLESDLAILIKERSQAVPDKENDPSETNRQIYNLTEEMNKLVVGAKSEAAKKHLGDISKIKKKLIEQKTKPFSKRNEIDKITQDIEKNRNNIRSLQDILSLPKILECTHLHTTKTPNAQDFIECAQKSPDSNQRLFLNILYHAFVQDGTFGSVHDALYPQNIALHALLGYLWKIADNKSQVIQTFKQAQLIAPETILEEEAYTRENYEHEIKSAIISGNKVSFEEAVYAGYAYEVFDVLYPPTISYQTALSPALYGQAASPYPDCGETMLRNFFNLILFKGGGEFDHDLLAKIKPKISSDSFEKIDKIKNYYIIFPNIASHQSQDARDHWSNIVSNLNGYDVPDPKKNTDVKYDGYSNIKASPLGITNILNVVAKLTGDTKLKEDWFLGVRDEKGVYKKISKKLDRFCEIFSRENFILDWHVNGDKDLSSVFENFEFTINEIPVFMFVVQDGHFNFKLLTQNHDDWRKGKIKPEEALLQPFYQKDLSLFLVDFNLKNTSSIVYTWSHDPLPNKIALQLRLIFKIFGVQASDKLSQINIMRVLNLIRNIHLDFEKTHEEDSFIKDFAQTILMQDGKDLFKFEFDVENHHNINVFQASEYGLVKTMKNIIKLTPQLIYQIQENFNETSLHLASKRGNDQIIELLMGHYGDQKMHQLNQQDFFGKTPLHLTAQNGHIEAAKLLLKAGDDKNKQDRRGNTLLHIAIENGHLDFVKFLIELDVRKDILNNAGETPIHLGAEEGHAEIVKYLIHHFIDKNQKDSKGRTALHLAVENGHIPVVELLIQEKAELNDVTSDGKTALSLAHKKSYTKIIQLLTQAGAH